ncbi:MAG TPA: hypothetical protein DCG23_02510 [Deltaproteobacteria bacterium]|nr:hypothetical protein [Deltaproteobacteria bacterium]
MNISVCIEHAPANIINKGEAFMLYFSKNIVIDFSINKIEITSHNHGFSVDEKSLPKNVSVTHRNLNDKTIEGIESLIHPVFSVQYYPEVAPGPRDA